MPDAGLLSLPLVAILALHPSQQVKIWAQHVLSLLPPPASTSSSNSLPQHGKDAAALYGLPVLLQQAERQLDAMHRWSAKHGQGEPDVKNAVAADVLSPLLWLVHFEQGLQQVKAAKHQSKADEGISQPGPGQQDEVIKMILISLLDHPEPSVQAAAADACGAAVQAFPVTGISLLPLLMYKLRRSVAQGGPSMSAVLPLDVREGSTLVLLCMPPAKTFAAGTAVSESLCLACLCCHEK